MSTVVNMESSTTRPKLDPAEVFAHPQLLAFERLQQDRAVHGAEAVANQFKKFDHPRPYVTVIGFAMDKNGRFPIFHRSNKVRSAKNAWSIPSGLHEVGLPHADQFAAELNEELNLEVVPGTCRKIGFYEAIIYGQSGEDNWHWVLLLLAMRVKTLETLKNREPDKHDNIQLVTTKELYSQYLSDQWTMNLKEALLEYRPQIESIVQPALNGSF